MANAYMMRQDAKLFPVTIHYYAGAQDEALNAGEWLYGATQFPETKKLVVRLFAAYAKNSDPSVTSAELVDTLIYVIKRLPYHTASEAFVQSIRSELEKIDLDSLNFSALHTAVNDALDQEFLRMRIGGMYNSVRGNYAAYFRISSTGFNWFNNIWAWVYDNQNLIDAVTVMKDPESTGLDNSFYSHNGKVIKDMPVDEFITISGRPVLDSKATAPAPLFSAFDTPSIMRTHRKRARTLVAEPAVM